MFWNTDLANTSTLEALLKKEDLSLYEVLNDEYTLQELKNGNSSLIKFLTRPSILEEIIAYTLVPKYESDADEEDKLKVSHQSCEILTISSVEIAKAVMESNFCRNLIVTFLLNDRLNPLITSFYARITTQLLSMNTLETLELLHKGNFLDNAFKHINLSAIMDLLYRLVLVPSQKEDSDAVKQWFTDQNFAIRLAQLFESSQLANVHSNAAYLWSELVRILRDFQCTADEKTVDVLLDSLQSAPPLFALLNHMFPPCGVFSSDSVIVNGSSIFLSLLQTDLAPNCPANVSVRMDEDSIMSNATELWRSGPERVVETALCSRLDALTSRIRVENNFHPLNLPFGVLKTPLGIVKLTLIKLLACLLNTNNKATHESIVESGILPTLLRIPVHFPYNSLVHSDVVQCVQFSLFCRLEPCADSQDDSLSPLVRHLLVTCRLPEFIIEYVDCTICAKVAELQLYAYRLQLARWLELARMKGPNKKAIDTIIDEIGLLIRWSSFVQSVLVPYEKLNRVDDVNLPCSLSKININDDELPNSGVKHIQVPEIGEENLAKFRQAMDFVADSINDFSPQKINFEIDDETLADNESFETLCEKRMNTSLTKTLEIFIDENSTVDSPVEVDWPKSFRKSSRDDDIENEWAEFSSNRISEHSNNWANFDQFDDAKDSE